MRYTPTQIDLMTEYELNKVVLLDMSFMDLTAIPSKIFQMQNLEFMNISNNFITEFPKKIKKLTNLKSLYAKGNPISIIHENILRLPKLKEIYVDSEYIITSILMWVNSAILSEENNFDIDNLSNDVEHLLINSLNCELINLPSNLKSVHLVDSDLTNLKVPLNCQVVNWL